MSLNKFSKLFLDLDSSNSINNKIEVLKSFLSQMNQLIIHGQYIYLLEKIIRDLLVEDI